MKADLTFSLEHASTLDTLEAVLATARRGGLDLTRLSLSRNSADTAVVLRVCAPDDERIDLFRHRLRNIIGVHDMVDCTVEHLYIETTDVVVEES